MKVKCKGADLTIRRWFHPNKEEILVDDNFARLNNFKTKQDFIKSMLKDAQEINYQEGDNLWIEFDEQAQKITSVSVSKLEK